MSNTLRSLKFSGADVEIPIERVEDKTTEITASTQEPGTEKKDFKH